MLTISTEVIIIFLASLIVLGILVDDVRLRVSRKRLINSILQLTLDKATLQAELKEANAPEPGTEGFIKFLSESREAAFTYIEDVQGALNRYLDALTKDDKEQIEVSRMELFSYLPNETKNS